MLIVTVLSISKVVLFVFILQNAVLSDMYMRFVVIVVVSY